MSLYVTARNANLESWLNNFIQTTHLRFTYLRGDRRQKIGVVVNFIDTDANGRKEMYVGWSKSRPIVDKVLCGQHVQTKGDRFSLDVGLRTAIDRAVPFGQFVSLYNGGKLPKLPLTFRCVRDEHGYVVENEYEFHDQWEEFVYKLKNVYKNLVSDKVLI